MAQVIHRTNPRDDYRRNDRGTAIEQVDRRAVSNEPEHSKQQNEAMAEPTSSPTARISTQLAWEELKALRCGCAGESLDLAVLQTGLEQLIACDEVEQSPTWLELAGLHNELGQLSCGVDFVLQDQKDGEFPLPCDERRIPPQVCSMPHSEELNNSCES